MTAADLCTDVLLELGVLGAADTATGEDAAFVLGKLNRLLDNWNADQQAVYCEDLTVYTLTASLQPHTIGPSGDFEVAQRPVTVEAANLIALDGLARFPLNLRDDAWWQQLAVPALTGIPSDLFYSPAWPNGFLFFYPIPSSAFDLELFTRAVLAQLDLASTFSLPPGYQDAITLTLAEECAAAFRVPLNPQTVQSASKARARVFGANLRPVRLTTLDTGMPGSNSSRRRSTFNYLTGR